MEYFYLDSRDGFAPQGATQVKCCLYNVLFQIHCRYSCRMYTYVHIHVDVHVCDCMKEPDDSVGVSNFLISLQFISIELTWGIIF